MALRVVIADDEANARERLRGFLAEEGAVRLVAECANGAEALEAIRRHAPDVVFLDIQMPELNGLEVLQALPPGQLPAVVFVSAYDCYAIEAFDLCAADYVLKPFDRARIRQTLETVGEWLTGNSLAANNVKVRELGETSSDRIVVRSEGRIQIVNVMEIDWIVGARNYAELHVGQRVHLLRETLGSLETRLPRKQFVRVSKSAFVNVDRITELRSKSHGDVIVVLQDGTQVTATRTYRARMVRELGK